MVYSFEIDQPTELISQINDNLSNAPKLFNTAYKRNMSRLRSRWIQALKVEPPEASNYYKLPWKSDKQRRAFFATKGFGKGIPYQRTHELRDAWDVEIDTFDDGGSVVVTNDAPESLFVYGDMDTPRQPMFEKIPWLDPDGINGQFQDEAEEVLLQTFITVFDPFAGIPE